MIRQSKIAYESQLVKNSPGCPKRLFSYIKRRTRKSDAIPSLMLGEDSENIAEDNLTKAEALSKLFSQVLSNNSNASFTTSPEKIGNGTLIHWKGHRSEAASEVPSQ